MKTRQRAQSPSAPGEIAPRSWVLAVYRACLANARALIEEAELLLAHKHSARAYFLAYTAIEELGKSQVVADSYYDLVSEKEFEAAFRDHVFKAAYVTRYVQVPAEIHHEWFIEYDKVAARKHIACRERALYVERCEGHRPQSPVDEFSHEDARRIIDTGRQYLEEIDDLELMTNQIGTKAFTK